VGPADYGVLCVDLYFYEGACESGAVQVGGAGCAGVAGFDDLYGVGHFDWGIAEMKAVKVIDQLLRAGVQIPEPSGVEIGAEVDVGRIAPGVVIHPGSRIAGRLTSIGPKSEIGAEGPVVMEECRLGRGVKLKGCYFSHSVFMDGASMGLGAHVRAGTILEEEASGAHTVGLKQTLLMPFVTLGSLINFCDVLMAGGTSRSDHSEVGSSYIHFNYTPHQDKATASLVGEVPKGVFLRQRPIFLGGQGGLVGPASVAYGCVVGAGGICRQSLETPNELHIPASPPSGSQRYDTGVYRNISRIVKANLAYIGNIVALREWYRSVRSVFMRRDRFDIACYEGGLQALELVLEERIKRMRQLAEKMEYSISRLEHQPNGLPSMINAQRALMENWPAMEFELEQNMWSVDLRSRDAFLGVVEHIPVGGDYTVIIQSLEERTCESGERWLQSIVDAVCGMWPPKRMG
jgi:UDP-N-acetylglucosamine/UDP-N-acetylgalactosamine diphosphorylase